MSQFKIFFPTKYFNLFVHCTGKSLERIHTIILLKGSLMKKCNCSQLQWTSNILLNQQLIKWKGLETSIDRSLSRLTYGFTEVKDCECQDMINITCDVSRTDNSYRKRLIVKLPLKKFFLISFHMIDKAT